MGPQLPPLPPDPDPDPELLPLPPPEELLPPVEPSAPVLLGGLDELHAAASATPKDIPKKSLVFVMSHDLPPNKGLAPASRLASSGAGTFA
jgi:hypothetical protein